MDDAPRQAELEAAHCWERDDHLPKRPATTAFRRRARLHQARWREAEGLPIGTQPIAPKPGKPSRPVGSRLPLGFAVETGAAFVTRAALAAARNRAERPEAHQTFDHQRHWADLLWGPSLAFNLLGDLWADPALADRVAHAWWPDLPGAVGEVRFAHSPGRFDPTYLNSLRAFDALLVLDDIDGGGTLGGRGGLALSTKYHEWAKPETPRPENLDRYLEVAERSGAFRRGALDGIGARSPLAVLWLEHLLLLSMLQHPTGEWTWGRYVVVHPAGNQDQADTCDRYRDLLADDSTFTSVTLESLLDAEVLPGSTTAALRRRYVVG